MWICTTKFEKKYMRIVPLLYKKKKKILGKNSFIDINDVLSSFFFLYLLPTYLCILMFLFSWGFLSIAYFLFCFLICFFFFFPSFITDLRISLFFLFLYVSSAITTQELSLFTLSTLIFLLISCLNLFALEIRVSLFWHYITSLKYSLLLPLAMKLLVSLTS